MDRVDGLKYEVMGVHHRISQPVRCEVVQSPYCEIRLMFYGHTVATGVWVPASRQGTHMAGAGGREPT